MDASSPETPEIAPRSTRVRLPSRALGLSGKLLLLTIPLVMIAEVLIYVPSIANFYQNRLNDRLAAANIPPMTMEEIQAEVDAVRKARRERAGRS